MWFQKRHRSERELRAWDETYLERTDVVGSAAPPSMPYPVDNVPITRPAAVDPRNMEAYASAPSVDGRVRYRQINHVKPAGRRLARNLVIAAGAPNEIYSAYNRLRTQVVKRLEENDWNSVAITSPSEASGNTTTAINLAISIARDFDATVLLVELNFTNPSFRRIIGFKERNGITDYLLCDVPISEIRLNPAIDRLVVIPAGSPVSNGAELLSSFKMTQLIGELKNRYARPIVLFDLPSALMFDDAIAFSSFVDCALLVVEEGETRMNDIRRALDYLSSTKILGVVLNRSNEDDYAALRVARL